jgi:hypothetical protein
VTGCCCQTEVGKATQISETDMNKGKFKPSFGINLFMDSPTTLSVTAKREHRIVSWKDVS